MRFLLSITVLLFATTGFAKKLSDYTPYEWDVRFTNPTCATYEYDEPIKSRSGKLLTEKPKNAYCSRRDAKRSGARKSSPQYKMLEWINDPNTTEIFFTFLSFSNGTIQEALCDAIIERDVKVTFVLDSGTDLSRANKLLACKASEEHLNPELHLRGHVSGMGYAHNKIVIINPNSEDEIKISFGSANMSSGIVLHHENWHFVTTSVESYFAQAHLCVMNAEIDHAESGRQFRGFMKRCLGNIDSPEESDVKLFFVPGQGKEATAQIEKALGWASEVKLAAHRFSYTRLIESLKEGLRNKDYKLKLVFDDDLFWVAHERGLERPNNRAEYRKAESLMKLGATARYIETNHKVRLLHHNKFMVFKKGKRRAAFFGAGNFTGTAFSTNLENFYYVTIPEVTGAMDKQHDHLYYKLGTAEGDLPRVQTAP